MSEEEIVVEAEYLPLTTEQDNTVDPLLSGFAWYKPPPSFDKIHKTGEYDWKITGHDMQVLTSSVPAGQHIETEVGSFVYMHPDMKTEVGFTLCGAGGCSEGCPRILGGESCVKVYLKNDTNSEGYVGLTPNYPAKIVPIKFGVNADAGSSIIAQPGSYMTQIGDVKVGHDCDCGPRTCCCAGFGVCRQKISGSEDSIAFVTAGGTIVYKELGEDETIIVDSGSVLAHDETVQLGITPNGRFCTFLCGGEGCCSTTLSGPGKVWMQSMNFQKFKNNMQFTVNEDDIKTPT